MNRFEEMLEKRDSLENEKQMMLNRIIDFNRVVKKSLMEDFVDEALTINWNFLRRQCRRKPKGD